ncbi:hypothetical protein CO151_03985 [bacterium CG_4_9_14_3_um_filter_65_15]|nr:MAG: hypothetical protein CO151_03985 [bacterium CG_4_9_14_3_um_filter_65_15]
MKLLAPSRESKSVFAWRQILFSCLLVLATTAVVSLDRDLHILPSIVAITLAGFLLASAWILVLGFLLLDCWGTRLWILAHGFSLVLILVTGKVGMVLGLVMSGFFLTFRWYRPWRLVSPRNRAIGFGLGFVMFAALILGRRFWNGEASGFLLRMQALGGWALGSLILFWFWSQLHLVLRMRLHFLRLRPKLAVNAILIGFIPLVLISALGLTILYTGLGGSRAVRARDTLDSWRTLTDAGADFSGALFDTTFTWPDDGTAGAVRIPAPEAMQALARNLRGFLIAEADSVGAPARADTTCWFVFEGSVWLMRWRGLDTESPRAEAWKLGQRPLKALSRILGAAIEFSSISAHRSDSGIVIGTTDSPDDRDVLDAMAFPGIRASYRDIDSDSPFWNRFLYFGGTLFPVLTHHADGLNHNMVFINLKVGWPEITADFFKGESNLNIAVMVVLGLLIVLFLVLELFAVFFGVRITEGIVTAVHSLHRGMTAVAGGELNTRVTLPNEDEFGDLAAGFNDMTMSLLKGREIALANDRLKQELSMARSIQERLLPGVYPTIEGFEVVGTSIPSREIGGDYYDFMAQGEDLIGIAIGDVSGKGMPAALLMSNLQASLHGQVLHPGSVSSVVTSVNDLLVRSTDPHMFATFFYGLLDTGTGHFTCTNAGHNPPLVVRSDGAIEHLSRGGLLLGMLEDQVYQQDEVDLGPGDVIVMYTDGITEAVGPGVEEDDPEAMFGEDALEKVILENRHLPAAGIQEAILAAVGAHTAEVPQSDDITLVVIRRRD